MEPNHTSAAPLFRMPADGGEEQQVLSRQ